MISGSGKVIFVAIPVSIVALIIIHIIYAIINKIVTNEDIPTIDDERDRIIELKSIRISHWIFTTGFICAMGVLAFGAKPSACSSSCWRPDLVLQLFPNW
jgi:hypothetical protein